MHKLYYLQNKFKSLPEQGSVNWLEGRKYAFGGSEIASVLDMNDYCDFQTCLDRKKNKTCEYCDATEWGHFFEPIAKIYIKKHLQCEIHEFGSVPHPTYPVCYSPDGLIVKNDDLYLLEIKCPIKRDIKKIPASYLLQVKTGMNVFPVNGCYFYQFKFRRCALWSKSDDNGYDRKYHCEPFKRCPKQNPIDHGYLHWDIDCDLIDLGTKDSITFYTMQYKDIKPTLQIGGACTKQKGLVLKWKYFGYHMEYIHPDIDFLQNNSKLLWEKYKDLTDQNNATLPCTKK